MTSRRCFTLDEALAELMREDDEDWLFGGRQESSSDDESDDDRTLARTPSQRDTQSVGDASTTASLVGGCDRGPALASGALGDSTRSGLRRTDSSGTVEQTDDEDDEQDTS